MKLSWTREVAERRPSVSTVSPSQPKSIVVPDLAIEVNGPINKGDELLARIREYFGAGIRRVWAVYPYEGLVYDYRSFTTVQVLDRTKTLEGNPILPGFSLPFPTLFDDRGSNGSP